MNPTPIEDGDTQHIDVFDSVLLTIDPHDLLECAIDFHASQHLFLYNIGKMLMNLTCFLMK